VKHAIKNSSPKTTTAEEWDSTAKRRKNLTKEQEKPNLRTAVGESIVIITISSMRPLGLERNKVGRGMRGKGKPGKENNPNNRKEMKSLKRLEI
jgi:hypothetical protein